MTKISESTPENEAAICYAATAKETALANTLKEEREAESGRKDPNAPLTPGRLAYESVWHQHMQPQRWDHLHPVGDVPKGYVNPIPWIGVVKPADWDQLKDNPDSVDGKPPVPVNEMRIRHPSAVFMAPRRLQMYKDIVLVAADPQYLVLWAINIGGERWLEAEDLMVQDLYWWKVYQDEFGFSGKGAADAIRIEGHGGPGESSGTGMAAA
ncbi:MAG: hypothetical protein VX502_02710 [Candidatus Thermoplasmatota archaeon]|nr:hypothetical protein [Candidatus Thermoplasmatota archaeon]